MADTLRLKPIMYADFVRFLKAMNPNYECHFCGGTRFSISTDESGEDEVDLITPRVIYAPEINMPMASTYCAQCGATRDHVYHVVVNWIENNPESEEYISEVSEVDSADTEKEQ